MYSFEYQGIGNSGIVHNLTVTVEGLYVTCTYDNILTNIEYELSEFCEFSKDYNNNYGSGKKYLERDIFKKVPPYFLAQESFFELFRTFMRHTNLIFDSHFSKDTTPEKLLVLEDDITKRLIALAEDKSKNTIFSDSLHLDWTGDTSIQPQFFFIPNSLLIKKENLEYLYSLKLLYKFSLHINCILKIETFFVPISAPEIPWYKKFKGLSTWHEIVKSINDHIKNMTGDK